MAVLVPEVIIAKALNTVLSIVRTNHLEAITNNQESRSLLYLLFNGTALGNYDFYANAKNLIITTKQNPKHLEVKLSYDQNTTGNAAGVFLNLSSDTAKTDSISIGEGDQEELVFTNGGGAQNEYVKQYMRRFITTYQLVFIADNKNEISILYNLFRCMTIALTNHLALEGISNLKLGGQDLRVDLGIPDKLFIRAITLNFEYEVVTPEIFIQDVFTKIRFIAAIDSSDYYSIEDDSTSI
jgi:hypothetical protein